MSKTSLSEDMGYKFVDFIERQHYNIKDHIYMYSETAKIRTCTRMWSLQQIPQTSWKKQQHQT